MEEDIFGYKCQECGKGTVRDRVYPEYRTRVRGQPFIVTEAHIGVCDSCQAKHFAAQETKRWRDLFEEASAGTYLTAEEVRKTRTDLGLPMEQFALLVGCTRQSVHKWERPDRKRIQSRMADLIIKLVRTSIKKKKIDVLSFLVEQAQQVGVTISIQPPKPLAWPALVLSVQRRKVPTAGTMPLAADSDSSQDVLVIDTESRKAIGTLSYDYGTAALRINFVRSVEFDRFDVEVRFLDGTTETSDSVSIREQTATLLSQTKRTEDDVESVVIRPPRDGQGTRA